MAKQMPNEATRMQCQQFDLDLAAYIEGEARPDSAKHARECSPCGGILADLELIRSQAQLVLVEDPPASLWANVRAALASEGIFRESARSCHQFNLDLADYLEGEARPESAKHAGECSACGGILADLELIRSQAQVALLEDPPARLWANVRATLESEGIFREPAPRWLNWFPRVGLMHDAPALTALACMALFGVLLLVGPGSRVPNSTTPNVVQNQPPSENVGMEQTVNKMEAAYRSREKSLDPALQASYQKGLQSLDNSIRESKESVAKEPDNTLAREYLASAYEQKAAVLSAALEYDGQ